MNAKQEEHIEKFIRFPKELTQKECDEVKILFEDSKEARDFGVWLSEFYKEFDVLNRPVLFTLSNKRIKVMNSGPVVLAAMTQEKKKGLITKATFISEEESTLVRVLEDSETKKIQFHILSKFIAKEDRALIGFENSGIEFVTDKGGKLKDVKQESLSGINWDKALLLLRFSSSTCFYDPDQIGEKISVCEECTLTVRNGTGMFSTTEVEITRILVDQAGYTRLFYVDDKLSTFSIDELNPFTIHLYK